MLFSWEMAVVVALVAVMVVLFLREWLPVPITALLSAVVLVATGILTPKQGLSGFSSEATVAVMAMFVVSGGVQNTGVVAALTRFLLRIGKGGLRRQMLALGLAAGPVSGVVNNTPVVAVMIPAAQQLAKGSGVRASKLLMPLSILSMLGGLLTVVGTSTSLLGNASLLSLGLEPFGFFEFTIIGVIALAVGALYFVVLGPRLVPDRGEDDDAERFDLDGFVTHFHVDDGPLVGKTLRDVGLTLAQSTQVLRIKRGRNVLRAPGAMRKIHAGDLITIEADRGRLDALIALDGWRATHEKEAEEATANGDGPAEGTSEVDMSDEAHRGSAEVIITTGSQYVGKTIADIDLRRRYGALVMAVRHQRKGPVTGPLSQRRLHAGDVLLVEAEDRALERMREQPDLYLTRPRPVASYRTDRMPHALAIVAAVILVSALGWLPISIAGLAGACLMVVTGCLDMKQFLRSIHWDIVLLLGGIIPLGLAFEASGLAALIADGITGAAGELPLWAFLVVLFLVTSLVTEVMSNNASVVLFVPIAVAAAMNIGVDPRPVALTVILAASTSMLTPIGYQTNTMVYGPGRYQFRDYFRVGALLNLLLAFVIPFSILWWFT